jgi:hypothetical protein
MKFLLLSLSTVMGLMAMENTQPQEAPIPMNKKANNILQKDNENNTPNEGFWAYQNRKIEKNQDNLNVKNEMIANVFLNNLRNPDDIKNPQNSQGFFNFLKLNLNGKFA